jgi:hypothetical protein
MLKQSVSRIKKVLPVLLAVLFVVSLTAVSASAHGYYRGGCGYGLGFNYPFGVYPPIASVGVSPVAMTEVAVPAIATAAAPVVTTSTVATSPVVVASEPGVLTAPLATGLGYGPVYGYGLGYPGLGWGGWGYGGHHHCHHHS